MSVSDNILESTARGHYWTINVTQNAEFCDGIKKLKLLLCFILENVFSQNKMRY